MSSHMELKECHLLFMMVTLVLFLQSRSKYRIYKDELNCENFAAHWFQALHLGTVMQ